MNRIDDLKNEINQKLLELNQLIERSTPEEPELYQLFQGKNLIRIGTLRDLSVFTTLEESTLKSYSGKKYLENANGPESTRVIKLVKSHE